MSIMRMRRDFAQHLRLIMWVVLIVFLIGIPLSAFYFGGGIFGGGGGQQTAANKTPGSHVVIATVSGEPIRAGQLDALYNAALQQAAQQSMQYQMVPGQSGILLEKVLDLRYDVLQKVAADVAVVSAAKKRGITAGDDEVDAMIQQQVNSLIQSINQNAKAQKTDPRTIYRQYMAKGGDERVRVSENDFREWMVNSIDQTDRETIRQQVLTAKLQQQIVAPIRVTDADINASFDEAKLDAIIVPMEAQGAAAEIKAKKDADAHYAKLKAGQSFAAVKKAASTGPTPPSSEAQWVVRTTIAGAYGPEAEKAIFAAKPNSATPPVKLTGAYAIFQVEALRHQPPKDLAKKKESIRKNLLQQRQAIAWEQAKAEMAKDLKIVSKSPQVSGLQAYKAGNTRKALADFEKVINSESDMQIPADVYVAMCVMIAKDKELQKKYDEAMQFYERSVTPPGSFPNGLVAGFPDPLYYAMGQLALKQNNKAIALQNFQDAGSGDDWLVHMELLKTYKDLGQEKLVKQEEQWLNDFQQMQKEEAEQRKKDMEEYQKELAAQAAKEKPKPEAGEPNAATSKPKPETSSPKPN